MKFQEKLIPISFICGMVPLLVGCAGGAGAQTGSEDEFFEPLKSVPPSQGRSVITPQHNYADSLLQVRTDSLLARIQEQELRINKLTEQLQSKQPKPKQSPQPLGQTGKPLTYNDATGLFQQRNYKEAIAAFQQLLSGGIGEDLADNCQFWIGMSYFNLKNYDIAVEEFLKVLKYRASNKADGSYFMLGQSYERLGNRPKAKEMFETVMREFPTSALARDAKRKLDSSNQASGTK